MMRSRSTVFFLAMAKILRCFLVMETLALSLQKLCQLWFTVLLLLAFLVWVPQLSASQEETIVAGRSDLHDEFLLRAPEETLQTPEAGEPEESATGERDGKELSSKQSREPYWPDRLDFSLFYPPNSRRPLWGY